MVSHGVKVLNFYFKDKRNPEHQVFPFMGFAFGDKSKNTFLGLRSQRVPHIYSLLSFSFYIPSWVNFYLRCETEVEVHFPVYICSKFQPHLLKSLFVPIKLYKYLCRKSLGHICESLLIYTSSEFAASLYCYGWVKHLSIWWHCPLYISPSQSFKLF